MIALTVGCSMLKNLLPAANYFFSRCNRPFCVSMSMRKLLKKLSPSKPAAVESGVVSWTAAVRFLISIPPTMIELRLVSGASTTPLAV